MLDEESKTSENAFEVTNRVVTARPSLRARLIHWYYAATPLFALLDFLVGINFRVVFIDRLPMAKAIYYTLAFGCWFVMWKRPQFSRVLGLFESSTNVALLIISVFVAYIGVINAAMADASMENPFTPEAVMNFLIAAVIFTIAFYQDQPR